MACAPGQSIYGLAMTYTDLSIDNGPVNTVSHGNPIPAPGHPDYQHIDLAAGEYVFNIEFRTEEARKGPFHKTHTRIAHLYMTTSHNQGINCGPFVQERRRKFRQKIDVNV